MNTIRQYCAGTALYLDNHADSLQRVAEFSYMLECFYTEIEDLIGKLRTPVLKTKGYETQRAINTLIAACDDIINDVTAVD